MTRKDIKQHDRTLMEHELLEMKIKRENPDMEHWKAHQIASEKIWLSKGGNRVLWYWDHQSEMAGGLFILIFKNCAAQRRGGEGHEDQSYPMILWQRKRSGTPESQRRIWGNRRKRQIPGRFPSSKRDYRSGRRWSGISRWGVGWNALFLCPKA